MTIFMAFKSVEVCDPAIAINKLTTYPVLDLVIRLLDRDAIRLNVKSFGRVRTEAAIDSSFQKLEAIDYA